PVNPNGSPVEQFIDRQGQSRWYKFTIQPNSKVIVTLTNLPANYDLTIYKDITTAFNQLTSPQDLTRLNAEFAPDAFAFDAFAAGSRSPDTFAAGSRSPDDIAAGSRSEDFFNAFSSAQTRSLIGVSAFDGAVGEG